MRAGENIDDSAARNRPGATLDVEPTHSFTRMNEDGTIDEWVNGEWVPMRDGTRSPFRDN